MVPVGRLVLLRSIAKSDLVSAMAYLTVPALIGPVAGPPLGGFITTYFHWRWIFWINVPIGILGVLLSLRFIENLRDVGKCGIGCRTTNGPGSRVVKAFTVITYRKFKFILHLFYI